eukprot:scaffold75240_cov26-Tisochrysis_lutea.AAC.2
MSGMHERHVAWVGGTGATTAAALAWLDLGIAHLVGPVQREQPNDHGEDIRPNTQAHREDGVSGPAVLEVDWRLARWGSGRTDVREGEGCLAVAAIRSAHSHRARRGAGALRTRLGIQKRRGGRQENLDAARIRGMHVRRSHATH